MPPKYAYSRTHMARHPPCVPSASCQPVRCHPAPPVCKRPEKCLRRSIYKKVAPCQSAVSIMSSRSKSSCSNSCGHGISGNPNSQRKVRKYLWRKSYETKLKRMDRLTGSHKHLKYIRTKGKPRAKRECCAGKGHRGRLRRRCCKCCRCCENCVIL